jgi:L-alanine-DL-glutamate epimerase-like enolase superfamily enzyme
MNLPLHDDLRIEAIHIWPIDINLDDGFAVSKGLVSVAENLIVMVCLSSGVKGYGEIAPFRDLTGEDRSSSLLAAKNLRTFLLGQSVQVYRNLSKQMAEIEPAQPAARAGLETAILDAFCRSLGTPLWAFWGGSVTSGLTTDITIPIVNTERTLELARRWIKKGFTKIKLKVGLDLGQDVRKIQLIAQEHPNVFFILDANQGFKEKEAVEFINELASLKNRILLFEQPVDRNDFSGMAAIRAGSDMPIVADESVTTTRDAYAVIQAKAADVINLKIMKSGVMEALEIASLVRASGLKLMIGGMVETRLAMSCSLAIALGIGGIEHLDLDTPLLLSDDPLQGGYQYQGPNLSPWSEPGLGLEPKEIPVNAPS